VHPVRYKYNGLAHTPDDGQEYIGVIAQELKEVAPFMVSSTDLKLHKSDTETTDVHHVDPNAFTYMLINAVKTLAAENRSLAEETGAMRRVLCKDHPEEAFCSKPGRASSF